MKKIENSRAVFCLEKYRINGTKVFLSRDYGKYIRETSKFDEMEKNNGKITFVIPDNIYHISVSFLEELLGNVVRKLGKDQFLKKYYFLNEGSYDFKKKLNKAIYCILNQKTHYGNNHYRKNRTTEIHKH